MANRLNGSNSTVPYRQSGSQRRSTSDGREGTRRNRSHTSLKRLDTGTNHARAANSPQSCSCRNLFLQKPKIAHACFCPLIDTALDYVQRPAQAPTGTRVRQPRGLHFKWLEHLYRSALRRLARAHADLQIFDRGSIHDSPPFTHTCPT